MVKTGTMSPEGQDGPPHGGEVGPAQRTLPQVGDYQAKNSP